MKGCIGPADLGRSPCTKPWLRAWVAFLDNNLEHSSLGIITTAGLCTHSIMIGPQQCGLKEADMPLHNYVQIKSCDRAQGLQQANSRTKGRLLKLRPRTQHAT